ncbi:hypothetical protein SPRG_05993 [Saprolegnia parasitica CBS 223.65]|uniref:START domain-containing protein n=1 Tax=Saprolegnia parasitica (strain CBS 223.65) TaxID=695850 RepID=A0A067CJT1_SAPPC|nr:hypothetical protein SPRG_05993 [Saprolegnia parasitica CBS 223.65]KDO29455.1 hypothetical protein SPRG_05993 [Saprolegnia parasitica CBS 223.65]|eukprot:XP_012199954.1 hypothetical protein SPRG_05993 [Saprolegnia parasitica CBS 223.65]
MDLAFLDDDDGWIAPLLTEPFLDFSEVPLPSDLTAHNTIKEETPLPGETPQKRYRERQKRELDYLRNQVTQLTAHLSVVQSLRGHSHDSHWEQVARTQQRGSHQAHKENARLKRALEEQLEVATVLEQLLVKRPKLAAFPTLDMVDAKLRHLPIAADARRASFLAIMADAYDRVDTTLLRRGLLDAPIGHRSFRVEPSTSGSSMFIDIQYVHAQGRDYVSAAAHFWSIWTSNQTLPGTFDSKVLERFGDDTVYMEQFDTFHGTAPYLRRLCGMQRIVENRRIVFVMRTILDDEKHPPVDGLYIGNDAATIVFEPKDAKWCIRRISLGGELPIQPPPENPLLRENPADRFICDFVLHEVTRTCDALERILA